MLQGNNKANPHSKRTEFKKITKCHCTQKKSDESNTESEDEDIIYIHKVDTNKAPIHVALNVRDKNVHFELDTGWGISVMSEDTFRSKFGSYKLNGTNIIIKTYSIEKLKVFGNNIWRKSIS